MRKITQTIGTLAATLTALTCTPMLTAHAAPTAAQHGYRLTPGPILAHKYHFSSEYLGTIETGGLLGLCIDYGKKSPDGHWTEGDLTLISDPTTRTRVQYLTNRYFDGALHSNTTAAALKSAVNRLRSSEFQSDWDHSYVTQLHAHHPEVITLTDRMISEATRTAGPVTLTETFLTKPTPGHPGTAQATATTNHHPATGQTITWSATNATTTTTTTRTSSTGTARVTFTPTGGGPVTLTATLTTPEWRVAAYSVPSSNTRQHLIRAAVHNTATLTAHATYDTKYKTTITQHCATECTGHPPITFTATAGATAVRWRATVGTKTVGTLNLKAHTTRADTFTGTDGQTITFAYQVRTTHGWSPWRTTQTFTVVCPAWPTVTAVKHCVCRATGSIAYTFTAPASSRFYTVTLTVNGVTQIAAITSLQTIALGSPLTHGDAVTAAFAAYTDAARTQQISAADLDSFTQN